MVKIIIGVKGSGKTKKVIDLVKKAAEEEKGNVVCVAKGSALNFDIPYSVRLIDVEDYVVSGYEGLFGFVSGLHAGNYDISHIFIDGIYRIVDDSEIENVDKFLKVLEDFSAKQGVKFTVTISEDVAKATPSMKKFM